MNNLLSKTRISSKRALQ